MIARGGGREDMWPKGRAGGVELSGRGMDGDPNDALESDQKDQRGGPKLRSAAKVLFADPELKTNVERANANANPDDQGNDG